VGVPAVLVRSSILAIVRDAAWAELEEKPSRRAAARATIKPQCKRSFLWRPSGLKEPTGRSYKLMIRNSRVGSNVPEEEVLSVRDIKIA
jgi:hypothetical protein